MGNYFSNVTNPKIGYVLSGSNLGYVFSYWLIILQKNIFRRSKIVKFENVKFLRFGG